MSGVMITEISLKEILTRIEEPLRSKVKEIISNAIKEAKMIIESRKREAYEIAKRKVHEKIFLKRSLELGNVEKKKRTELLMAKQEILETIRRMVIDKLQKIVNGEDPRYNYSDILYNLMKKAVLEINEDEIYVQANEKDTKYLKSKLSDLQSKLSQEIGRNIKIIILDQPIKCMGGIVARNKDGRRVFYGTIDGRLNEIFRGYRNKINKILFRKYDVLK